MAALADDLLICQSFQKRSFPFVIVTCLTSLTILLLLLRGSDYLQQISQQLIEINNNFSTTNSKFNLLMALKETSEYHQSHKGFSFGDGESLQIVVAIYPNQLANIAIPVPVLLAWLKIHIQMHINTVFSSSTETFGLVFQFTPLHSKFAALLICPCQSKYFES